MKNNNINLYDFIQFENQEKKPISLDSFYLLTIIGKGSYAKVSLVRKKDDNQVYALKAIKKQLIKEKNQREHVIGERNILQQVDNQYIVKMKYAFQDNKYIYFVLEFCPGGELYQLLYAKRQLTEQQTKFYAAQMVKAFEYLHSKNIIYRDLKPENVLITKEGYIKLTDFGLSKMNIIGQEAKSLCGTPEYLAPEILLQKGHGKPVDWWTLGNIIYEMVTGQPAFYNESRKTLFQNIEKNNPTPHPKIQGKLKSIINGLLEKDPNKRLGSLDGAKEIIEHPWFSDLKWDLLQKQQIVPPFVPKLDNEIDVRYIDPEFKEMSLYSPVDDKIYSLEKYLYSDEEPKIEEPLPLHQVRFNDMAQPLFKKVVRQAEVVIRENSQALEKDMALLLVKYVKSQPEFKIGDGEWQCIIRKKFWMLINF
ncbi:protein kinase domain protein [Ichthyophthirius multifiliis]|uniref:non-specific serine/threonine protein kinase n=1 Tax=Ichthyophthirius multifiliis TaxID=5932 RepID=G0QVE5_ICHMU|nr:protein kinase domain protein [Ichthyophthirius multifiliis]EGR30802.1 protein kinase domain protein [Ichthyophthirius multifiliis]|eukprot:XP_004032389.1 protein kinase domain protein [Ichthyophthirius multifiliis]